MSARVASLMYRQHEIVPGTRVGVRPNLNLPGKLLTVHSVKGTRPIGRVLSYENAVCLEDVSFWIDKAALVSIQNGANKRPMAAVVGSLQHHDATFDGVEVRFNPRETNAFVRVDDGCIVLGAERAIVVGNRCWLSGAVIYSDRIPS